MGKYYVSSKATCPFYRGELPQLIRCGIVRDGGTVQQAFGDKTDAQVYRLRRCCSRYQSCPIFRALEEDESRG